LYNKVGLLYRQLTSEKTTLYAHNKISVQFGPFIASNRNKGRIYEKNERKNKNYRIKINYVCKEKSANPWVGQLHRIFQEVQIWGEDISYT